MEDILQQAAELQEVVRRLHNIREAEEELDSLFQVQPAVDPQYVKHLIPTWISASLH